MFRVLAINPGATSTKIAVFEDKQVRMKKMIEHHGDELKEFVSIADQFPYRLDLVLNALADAGIALELLQATVGRGGLLRPIPGGTYRVDQNMLDDLKSAPRGEHASNLGAMLASAIAEKAGMPAFIVDPVAVDEMEPEARLSGMPDLPRVSMSHALNSKAVARRAAAAMGKRYEEVRFIVAHLGTGVSVTPHREGRMIDVNDAQQEGPFSPDRTGGLPSLALAKLCYSGKYSAKEMFRKISGEGGMYAYLNTRDAREAIERAGNGDEQAALVIKAMAYQTAKEIGAMAAVLCGKVDRILITGGLAHARVITDAIAERVSFIAPVEVYPGEDEMESLAEGAIRVLSGMEEAKVYK